LLLSLYLHHFCDRPWQRQFTDTLPLIRLADDLLVMCRSAEEARAARARLEQLLAPAGMILKGTVTTTVQDLAQGAVAEWLGFLVGKCQNRLAVRLGERSWDRLAEHLVLAHAQCDAPLRAVAVINGWLSQMGPCFAHESRRDVCQRIASLAKSLALDEIPSLAQLLEHWQRAYARWCRLRSAS
jgi:hypothetical protein